MLVEWFRFIHNCIINSYRHETQDQMNGLRWIKIYIGYV